MGSRLLVTSSELMNAELEISDLIEEELEGVAAGGKYIKLESTEEEQRSTGISPKYDPWRYFIGIRLPNKDPQLYAFYFFNQTRRPLISLRYLKQINISLSVGWVFFNPFIRRKIPLVCLNACP